MVDNEQDRMLPIANVGRIMKQVLPARAKISKEAKQTMQDCATEFLSFVTGEASDKCHKENRKTVNGDDICWALSALGFDNYAQATLTFLHKYREAERDKAASASASVANNQNINKPQHQIKLKHHQPSHEVKQVEEKSHQTPNLEFRMLHEKGHEDYN